MKPSPSSSNITESSVDARQPGSPSCTDDDKPHSNEPLSPRFSFSPLRFSLKNHTRPHTAHAPSVSHQAQVCYVVLTGSIPPAAETGGRKARRPFAEKSNSLSSSQTENRQDGTRAPAHGGKGQEPAESKGDAKAIAKPKAVKKLKSDLLKPAKARAIVADLKRMNAPGGQTSPAAESDPLSRPRTEVRAFGSSSVPIPTSVGGVMGLASAQTGVFEVLADVSGVVVRSLKSGTGAVVAPSGSIGLFLYWWGYEISLPPPTLSKLSAVHSVQQTFLGFLQAFVLAGGAPEIAPFVRYISNFIDMEYSAIQSQNKGGKGVVLAATWLLPVALVPRPWDFALPPRSAGSVTNIRQDDSSPENQLFLPPTLPPFV